MTGLSGSDWVLISLSLKVALLATLMLAPVGVIAGALLARYRGRWRWVFETVVNLPLVLPPVVLGFVLLMLFRRDGLLGGWLYDALGLKVVLGMAGAVLAAMVVSFPLLVQSVRIAVEGVDPRLEEAARTLGAGRLRILLTITFPLAWRGIAAGLMLAFTRSLGEFGATLVVAGNIAGKTRTLPLGIFTHLTAGRDAAAWRLAAVAVVLAAGAMLISHWLLRRQTS